MKQWCIKNGIDPRLYGAWVEMRRRCRASRHANDYRWRGITVCLRWTIFTLFAKDMGPHPGKGWTLDRKKNNQGYYKRNCRWATYATQARNRTNNKLTTAKAKQIRDLAGTMSQAAIGRKFGICQGTVCEVMQREIWK